MSEEREEDRAPSMREIGKKGGRTTAGRYGHDHYVRIGKLGAARMKELLARGKATEAEEEGDGVQSG